MTQTFNYKVTLKDSETANEEVIVYTLLNHLITSPHLLISQKTKLKSVSFVLHFMKLNQSVNDVAVLKTLRDEKLIKTFSKQLYHHLMIIEQAESAVIEVNNTD